MSRQSTSLASHSFCLGALGPQGFQGHQMSQLWNLLIRPASTFLMFRRGVKLLFISSWSKEGKFDLPDPGCYFHNLTLALSGGTVTPAGSLHFPCHLHLSCPSLLFSGAHFRCSHLASVFTAVLLKNTLSFPWAPQSPRELRHEDIRALPTLDLPDSVQESSGFVSNHPLDTELSLGARRSDKDDLKQLLF